MRFLRELHFIIAKKIEAAGRRQKKKSRRAAALLTRLMETTALKNRSRRFLCPLQTNDDL